MDFYTLDLIEYNIIFVLMLFKLWIWQLKIIFLGEPKNLESFIYYENKV